MELWIGIAFAVGVIVYTMIVSLFYLDKGDEHDD